MYLKLLTIFILICFRTVCADDRNKTKDAQSNLKDNSGQIVQNSSEKESSKKILSSETEKCLSKYRSRLGYNEMFRSSENQMDVIRYSLIKETVDDICSWNAELDFESYISPVSGLCDKDFKKNSSRVIPSTPTLVLDTWKNFENSNCTNICLKTKDEYYVICQFIFNYYTDRGISSKTPTLAFKTKPNLNNNEDQVVSNVAKTPASAKTKTSIDEVPQNEDDPGFLNPDEENSVQEGIPPDQRQGSDRKKMLVDTKLDEQKPSPPKDVSSKDEVASSHNNEENSQDDVADIRFSSSKISDDGDSHAFFYFVLISGICIVFYLMMYNKKKILAFMIEGRRRNVKRRPYSAAYSKLDCNLEEAMASDPSTSVSNMLLY